MNCMGSVQRALLVLQKRKFASISTDIRDKLNWLPISERKFKICVLVYRCIHVTLGTAPYYLAEMLAADVPALQKHRSAALCRPR